MIEAARIDSGIPRWNHNEADAYIVARSAARFWEFLEGTLLEDELTPSERAAFLNEHTITRGPRKGKTIRKGIVFKERDRFFQFSRMTEEEAIVVVSFELPEVSHAPRKKARPKSNASDPHSR